MVLSDADIRDEMANGHLEVDPCSPEQIQPASIDLTLGDELIVYERSSTLRELYPAPIDPDDPERIEQLGQRVEFDEYALDQGAFYLGTTAERISLPRDVEGELKGVSSVARLGVIPHTQAGVVDPGFEGQLTLEIVNFNPYPVTVRAGMRFCQLVLERTDSPAVDDYGEKDRPKYQGQTGPTLSRIHEDADD